MNDYREESGPIRATDRGHPPTFATDPFSRQRPAGSAFRARILRPSRMGVGLALAILVAMTALVIALVSLLSRPSAPVGPSSSPQSATTADKALCQAIGPLMKENDDRSNAFLASGQPGTPQRDAALPKFVSDTQDWARRTQQVLDAHSNPPRFTTRALQRYIDDMQLFVASVRPGPGTQYDEAAWTDSIVAYGGPLTSCQQLGISW